MMETYKVEGLPAAKISQLLHYIDTEEDIEIFTSKFSDIEIDDLLSYVKLLKQYSSVPVGINVDTSSSSPAVTVIDINGNTISPSSSFFDNWVLTGGMRRCTRDRTTGIISYGTNNRGDGLTIDSTAGDALVSIPTARYKYMFFENDPYFWLMPNTDEYSRFTVHPLASQRGGVIQPKMFMGAFEAYGYLDSGTFKLGSASGKQPVTGAVNYTDLPNSGRFTMDDAEDYANNIGTGFGITNLWASEYIHLLMVMEYGTFDLQSKLGIGVGNLVAGTGFAGKNTGADDIYSHMGINGTYSSAGLSTDGTTPICYRGIENPYGNVYKYVIGLNANPDGTYRVLNRSGTTVKVLPATLTEDISEAGSGTLPLTAGFIKSIQPGGIGALSFLPNVSTGGSSTTYLCDYYYPPQNTPSLLRTGGGWTDNELSGINFKNIDVSTTRSYERIGARIEYYPQ